ncbi:MAG: ACT domain-containing protein, partial [Sandaracinaceae bacterium]
GIVIHQRRCRHMVHTKEPERVLDIDWGPQTSEGHGVDIEIRAQDRSGLMGELSKLVSAMGVNIQAARAEGNRNGAAWIHLSLECRSTDEVARVLGRLARHPDVLEVRRVHGR